MPRVCQRALQPVVRAQVPTQLGVTDSMLQRERRSSGQRREEDRVRPTKLTSRAAPHPGASGAASLASCSESPPQEPTPDNAGVSFGRHEYCNLFQATYFDSHRGGRTCAFATPLKGRDNFCFMARFRAVLKPQHKQVCDRCVSSVRVYEDSKICASKSVAREL